MEFGKLLRVVTKGLETVIKSLRWVGYSLIGIMTLVVVGNVVGRYLFNQPLLGTVELVELMMVIIAFLAIPYTAVKRGHVTIGLIISRLSRRTRAVLGSITFSLSAAVFAVITYQATVNAIYYTQHLRESTDALFIPYAPFRSMMVLGSLLVCLTLLLQAFQPLPSEEEPKRGPVK